MRDDKHPSGPDQANIAPPSGVATKVRMIVAKALRVSVSDVFRTWSADHLIRKELLFSGRLVGVDAASATRMQDTALVLTVEANHRRIREALTKQKAAGRPAQQLKMQRLDFSKKARP